LKNTLSELLYSKLTIGRKANISEKPIKLIKIAADPLTIDKAAKPIAPVAAYIYAAATLCSSSSLACLGTSYVIVLEFS
jgi:hypothetical protein